VKFYKEAMESIAESIVLNVLDSDRPRFVALLQETEATLFLLDKKAAKWARRNITKLYRGNLKFVDRKIKVDGKKLNRVGSASANAGVHDAIIRDLILNPENGLGPRLKAASDGVRKSIKGYVKSHRALLRQIETTNRSLASSILKGETAPVTADAVLSAFSGESSSTFMGLPTTRVTNLAKGLIDAPFVTYANGKKVSLDHYVRMLSVTKESEVRTRSRNARLQERGLDLVQVTPNPPITPDACSLYAGRVFALTREASARTGYPMLSQTPNGGPPFHPFCTHSTLPWIEELQTKSEVDDAEGSNIKGLSTTKGVPNAILDVDFKQANAYFKKKGGMKFAAKQNPQLKKAQVSSVANKEVRDALEP